ncbi:MAG: hypothetical protein JEZ09_07345 [Salinivirgaceae bacterium]|nr:hypothetical protein [Salinivirgaceae bacterium]
MKKKSVLILCILYSSIFYCMAQNYLNEIIPLKLSNKQLKELGFTFSLNSIAFNFFADDNLVKLQITKDKFLSKINLDEESEIDQIVIPALATNLQGKTVFNYSNENIENEKFVPVVVYYGHHNNEKNGYVFYFIHNAAFKSKLPNVENMNEYSLNFNQIQN